MRLTNIQSLKSIMPKIFRRLTCFCEKYGEIAELTAYLKKDKDPIRLADGSKTTLHQLIVVAGRKISLLKQLEDMLFLSEINREASRWCGGHFY